MHIQYKICANQQFVLPVRLPVNSRLLEVKFQGSQSDTQIFQFGGSGVGGIPLNPYTVQGSTVFCFWLPLVRKKEKATHKSISLPAQRFPRPLGQLGGATVYRLLLPPVKCLWVKTIHPKSASLPFLKSHQSQTGQLSQEEMVKLCEPSHQTKRLSTDLVNSLTKLDKWVCLCSSCLAGSQGPGFQFLFQPSCCCSKPSASPSDYSCSEDEVEILQGEKKVRRAHNQVFAFPCSKSSIGFLSHLGNHPYPFLHQMALQSINSDRICLLIFLDAGNL